MSTPQTQYLTRVLGANACIQLPPEHVWDNFEALLESSPLPILDVEKEAGDSGSGRGDPQTGCPLMKAILLALLPGVTSVSASTMAMTLALLLVEWHNECLDKNPEITGEAYGL
ncbi:hypothetical protein PSPO01_11180 [Paraphaeosphaeria sporulosa]